MTDADQVLTAYKHLNATLDAVLGNLAQPESKVVGSFYPRIERARPWTRVFSDIEAYEKACALLRASYEKIVLQAGNQTVWLTATDYVSGLTITGISDIRRTPERKHLWEGVCNFPQNGQVSAEVVRYIDVFGDGGRVWWLF